MDDVEQLIETNRANWNSRAHVHRQSRFYDLDRYVADAQALSDTVEWDRDAIGDVTGLDVLHLQCHVGKDSISWVRLGAVVTGLDFSLESLLVARDLSIRSGDLVRLVCADVRTADHVLRQQFDLVYASVGILCWIPDIDEWVRAAAGCVRPGGRLYLRDGHPLNNTFDYKRDDDQLVLVGDYFGSGGPERDDAGYTYTGDDVRLDSPVNFQWSHPLSEIITAFATNGLHVERVDEMDWLGWKALPSMVRGGDGRWRLPEGNAHVPLMFSIMASKPLSG